MASYLSTAQVVGCHLSFAFVVLQSVAPSAAGCIVAGIVPERAADVLQLNSLAYLSVLLGIPTVEFDDATTAHVNPFHFTLRRISHLPSLLLTSF